MSEQDNAADPKQVQKGAKRERLDKRQAREDLVGIMSNSAGRRFIWSLMLRCGIFKTGFSTCALTMANNEGHRNVGLGYLMDINEFCPEMYAKMLAEARERDNS